ncbi:hypothetical protein DESC_540028 [Desulfosarcina cetonica]|nr:hypothetical protein DESC_540028 [Desulfosarcina cetonica]
MHPARRSGMIKAIGNRSNPISRNIPMRHSAMVSVRNVLRSYTRTITTLRTDNETDSFPPHPYPIQIPPQIIPELPDRTVIDLLEWRPVPLPSRSLYVFDMEDDDLVIPIKAIFGHKDIRDVGVWFEERLDVGIFPQVPVSFRDII